MELKEVIKTAQSHLEKNGASMDDVLESFKSFIEVNTHIERKEWCKYWLVIGHVWEAAEDNGVIVSESEAIKLIEDFHFNNVALQEIDENLENYFKHHLKDFPKGSVLQDYIREDNVEKINVYFQHFSNAFFSGRSITSDLFYLAIENKSLKVLDWMLNHNLDGIELDVVIDESLISEISEPEIKELLRKSVKV